MKSRFVLHTDVDDKITTSLGFAIEMLLIFIVLISPIRVTFLTGFCFVSW